MIMKVNIKPMLSLLAAFLFASPASAGWEIVKVQARSMEAQAASGDFWLDITLRNASGDTVYVQGLPPAWYMVEAYVKDPAGQVWRRQSIGVDQKLEMLPVAPSGSITITRRENTEHIGRPMLLDFLMAHSEFDTVGSRILVGEFKIPKPR